MLPLSFLSRYNNANLINLNFSRHFCESRFETTVKQKKTTNPPSPTSLSFQIFEFPVFVPPDCLAVSRSLAAHDQADLSALGSVASLKDRLKEKRIFFLTLESLKIGGRIKLEDIQWRQTNFSSIEDVENCQNRGSFWQQNESIEEII
jgi:hypothetical protein